MAGLRDRPMMRDALLAGGVIAASAVTALIALDRGPRARPHFDFAISAPDHLAGVTKKSRSTTSSVATHESHAAPSANALPKQIGFTPPPRKNKPRSQTVVMMVGDLPGENPEQPLPSGVWNEQGSGAPLIGGNSQPTGQIALSAFGGISAPLTSPTGDSLPSSPVSSGSATHPGISNTPRGTPPPAARPAVATNSGFVLVAGGQGGGQFALASAELFNPAKNAFAATSAMTDARADLTATVLPGGKILVVGGEAVSGRALSSAEMYDPIKGTFSAVASTMDTARAGHTATLISGCNCPANGKVLIAGGTTAVGSLGATIGTAELFDPATGKFTATGAMKATRAGHSATLIASGPLAGNVLIAGGTSDESGGDVATAELYDPATGQFTPTGRMSTPRENHSATWLSPSLVSGTLAGSVLIAGGGTDSVTNDSAEVFNPQMATFSPVGAMTTARSMHSALLLANGKVLIAGGQSSDTDYLLSAELFDPARATFAATGSMHNLHLGAVATVLESGHALIAGGRSSRADLYDPMAGTFSETGNMVTDLAESTSSLIR